MTVTRFATSTINNNNNNNFHNSCVNAIKNHPLFSSCEEVNKSLLGNSAQYKFTPATAGEIVNLGFDETEILSFLATAGQKQHMRMIQGINSLNQGLLSSFDKSHAKGLITLFVGGSTGTRSQSMLKSIVASRMGLTGNEGSLVARAKELLDVSVGVGAAVSKNSNSVGEFGYMQLLGITMSEGFGHNRIVHLNLEHRFVLKFLSLIEKLTPAQLAATRESFKVKIKG